MTATSTPSAVWANLRDVRDRMTEVHRRRWGAASRLQILGAALEEPCESFTSNGTVASVTEARALLASAQAELATIADALGELAGLACMAEVVESAIGVDAAEAFYTTGDPGPGLAAVQERLSKVAPVPAPRPGPRTMRVERTLPDGGTLVVTVDPATGEVDAEVKAKPDGNADPAAEVSQ